MIDYIKLARQAGIDALEVESERASMWPATPEGLANFAELVQAAERERWANAMRAVMCSPVGVQALEKLAAGQGTNTPGGCAWLHAKQMLDELPNTEVDRASGSGRTQS